MNTEPLSLVQDDDLRRKNTQHNACAPISKLPDELLSEIFLLLADLCPLKSWFTINLICERWRNVAVGTCSLWSKPPTYHHDLTVLMLERSKGADLHIHLSNIDSNATTTAIMGQVERIQSLSVMQPTELLESFFDILRTSPHRAARLESIRIHGPEDLDGASDLVPAISFRQLPRLCSLELSRVKFDWEVLPLPALTNLFLEEVEPYTKIPVFQLLERLSQMSYLENLKLTSTLFSPSGLGHIPSSLTTVALPHLSSLEIPYIDHQQLEVILSRMKLPRLRLLQIVIEYDDYSSLKTAISSTLMNGDFGACDVLVVTSDWLRLIPSTEDALAAIMSVGLEATFIHNSSYSWNVSVATKFLPDLSDKILSRVTQLVLHDMFPSDRLRHVFASHLPCLESIAVEDLAIRPLVNLLNTHTQHVPDTSIGIPFSNLKNITFDQRKCDQETWEEVLNCFRLRRNSGAPIQRLCLNKFVWPNNGVLASLNDLGIAVDHRVGPSYTWHAQD
ncbi:hypothetical protein D9619_012270 [Psilocybe cf. subviscida]|uniref:F-box domain-containing protein n=1 Tax=Psilocybe cf. subviscida TaxID=2480587 RepID=A0A8H5B729_9AGAR|nr:hypothetical protein D9619_012270 [Psilocybe cf. subviscida]